MENIAKKVPSELEVIYGDVSLGVKGIAGDKEFHYIFSYAAGGPVSFCVEGREWLYRSPRPAFWRAVTDNDRGCGFPLKSGMWMATDTFIRCAGITVEVDGKEIPFPCAPANNVYSAEEKAQTICVTYTYQTVTNPETEVTVAYGVDAAGNIQVDAHYFGKKGLPELPVFGMRFIMPTCAERFVYQGLSGETYPDRKAGGVHGVYEVEGLPVTPHLVPQDCGMHMDSDWVEVWRSKGLDNSRKEPEARALRFEMDKMAFSCLPYTALELESATHQEELPLPRRTVLCIYGAVRGVGGINSWGADVEDAYHVDGEKDIQCSFRICGPDVGKAERG